MQAMDFGDARTMHTREMEEDADGNVMTEVAIVQHRHRSAEADGVRG